MNGKGDRNRSFTQAYRDGWDRIFDPLGFTVPPRRCQACNRNIPCDGPRGPVHEVR